MAGPLTAAVVGAGGSVGGLEIAEASLEDAILTLAESGVAGLVSPEDAGPTGSRAAGEQNGSASGAASDGQEAGSGRCPAEAAGTPAEAAGTPAGTAGPSDGPAGSRRATVGAKGGSR